MFVATALNKKYVNYTIVMLTSLAKNQTEPVQAFLLENELEEPEKAYIRDALNQYDIEIEYLHIDKDVFVSRNVPYNQQWGYETYYRLLLLEVLPAEVDRLMYLDVDMIIHGDLSEVYHVDFEGLEIISCLDACGEHMDIAKFMPKQQEMFRDLFERGFMYANAGFMLFNIEEMRGKYSFQTYLDAMEEWSYEMYAPDQDILNYVHAENIGFVDYNEYDLFSRIAHNRKMSYEDVKNTAKIIHYAGDKPWANTNVHIDIDMLWWDYAKMTPCYNDLLEGFVLSSMKDNSLEKYIGILLSANEELKKNLDESVSINRKLLQMIQNK